MRKPAVPVVIIDHLRLENLNGEEIEALVSGTPSRHLLGVKLRGTGSWEYRIALQPRNERLKYDDGRESGVALLVGESSLRGCADEHRKQIVYDAQTQQNPEKISIRAAPYSRAKGFSGAYDELGDAHLYVSCNP